MRLKLIPVVVAVLVLGGVAAPAEAAPKVAVVDIVRCMEAHSATKKVEDALRAARQNAEQNLKKADERLKNLQRGLEAMNAQNPQRGLKERQYELNRATAKFNYEWDLKQAIVTYSQGLESIYRAVRSQIEVYARENGIEVVLIMTDKKQRLNAVDPKDFALKTRLRVVVYSDPRTDITDAIVKILESMD